MQLKFPTIRPWQTACCQAPVMARDLVCRPHNPGENRGRRNAPQCCPTATFYTKAKLKVYLNS